MASNRFRAENAHALVAALRERGIDRDATAVAPVPSVNGDRARRHPGVHTKTGEPMLSMQTRVSTRVLLRLAAELKLTLIH